MPVPNFVNISFPSAIASAARVKVSYKTTVIRMREGDEDRIGEWQDALREFDITAALRDQDDLDELVAFFRARLGPFEVFKIRDPIDYACIDEYIGVGNGSQTVFPLVKHYNSGLPNDNHTTIRAITLPDSPISVYVDGVLQISDYTVDYDDGSVIFTTALGVGLQVTWSGTFQVPVRFTMTRMYTNIEMFKQFATDIILREERASIYSGILAETEPNDFEGVIFPSEFSSGSRIGPQFDVIVIDAASGWDQRIPQFTTPKTCFVVNQDIRTFEEMITLLHFFHARRGRLVGFYAQDVSDQALPLVPVRFNSDQLEVSIDGIEIYNWSNIEMVEISTDMPVISFTEVS